MNIPSVILHENSSAGVELFHTDRRTCGRAEARRLIVAFRSCFANAPKGQLVSEASASVYYQQSLPATIPHVRVRGVRKPSRLLTRLFVVQYLIRIGERDCHGAGNFEHRRL